MRSVQESSGDSGMTPDCGVGQGLITCYLSAGDVGLLVLAATVWIVLGLAVGLVIGKIAYDSTGI